MDEFCANKDAQLKRCACSSRINEFDAVKKQLGAVEDKMLDFNQRLLTVSMEKEDAEALSVATEGETAYLSTKDTSDSKTTLDEISKKLNTNFNASNFNSDLNTLSWSLDMDSAFDNVDSLMGASTTTKTGTALYSAALPVCREMAAEVCNESDVSLAEGGYLALIEQDCNTVAKTYATLTAEARAKVLEGSALLDMSRLDVYQKRNSDDILTCKKKMLDLLTDSTVCGEDFGNCLDITGQYINPTTGEVFLKPTLINLSNLLTRPSDGATWTSVLSNSSFISYLNSKKLFLEPATEQCQAIADDVWDSFIEDALAQIKLAQDKKLDDVRQSCTVLTSQCLTDAYESITDFDARALSIFGINANRTATAMCSDVIESCTALLNSTDDNYGDTWNTGVSDITIATTYETMMQTCRQVGRSCIIQACTSTSGNFGLCENIDTSTNRKTIINREACWAQVVDCIKNVGKDAITDIIEKQLGFGENAPNSSISFYESMYGDNFTIANSTNATTCTNGDTNCVYDICADDCDSGSDSFTCRTCRLAENIWGNCEVSPQTPLDEVSFNSTSDTQNPHNRIKSVNGDDPTLLYWFAVNTGTETLRDSCRDTTCPSGFVWDSASGACIDTATEMCFATNAVANDDALSLTPRTTCSVTIPEVSSKFRCACCTSDAMDSAGNCCESGKTISETLGAPFNRSVTFCASSDTGYVLTEPYSVDVDNGQVYHIVMCDGGDVTDQNNEPECDGKLVDVMIAINNESGAAYPYKFYYKRACDSAPCSTNYDNSFVTNIVRTRNGIAYKWYGLPAGTFADSQGSSNNCTEGQNCTNRAAQWSVIFDPNAN